MTRAHRTAWYFGSRILVLSLLGMLTGCFLVPSQSTSYHNGAKPAKAKTYFKAKSLSLFGDTSCALDFSDALWCWGDSVNGAKILGLNPTHISPQRISLVVPDDAAHNYNISKFSQIEQNEKEICGISKHSESLGMVVCWGDVAMATILWNNNVATPIRAKKIAMAQGFGCGIDMSNILFCFGPELSLRGAFLSPSTDPHHVNQIFVSGAGDVVEVQTAGTTACALFNHPTNGQDLYCWGQDYFYAMNDSTAELPFATKMMDDVADFYLSPGKVCFQPAGVDENDNPWPWQCRGANYENAQDPDGSVEPTASTLSWYVLPDDGTGALGLDSNHLAYGAYQVSSAKVINDEVETVPGFVDPYQYFETLPYGCRVDLGEILCHGYQESTIGAPDLGRTGDVTSSFNDWTTLATSEMVGTNRKVKSFALGLNHGCLISENDYVHCWGSNQQGQLGAGASLPMFMTREPHPLPLE
ncbi:MAG TPA: RCC1 domain-containing protein [Bdellovibrionota bacterium]|jgi:hypothetical protein|nr:RCC1 domain-containing protein [Bdellovibrionota bacterium]